VAASFRLLCLCNWNVVCVCMVCVWCVYGVCVCVCVCVWVCVRAKRALMQESCLVEILTAQFANHLAWKWLYVADD